MGSGDILREIFNRRYEREADRSFDEYIESRKGPDLSMPGYYGYLKHNGYEYHEAMITPLALAAQLHC